MSNASSGVPNHYVRPSCLDVCFSSVEIPYTISPHRALPYRIASGVTGSVMRTLCDQVFFLQLFFTSRRRMPPPSLPSIPSSITAVAILHCKASIGCALGTERFGPRDASSSATIIATLHSDATPPSFLSSSAAN